MIPAHLLEAPDVVQHPQQPCQIFIVPGHPQTVGNDIAQRRHTFRVAALSDVITGSLGMTGYDKDLAWLLGMLHDIGRFEQVRRYHTFRDALSINHAELSADILFRDGLISNFINEDNNVSCEAARPVDCNLQNKQDNCSLMYCSPSPSDDYILIEKAIRLHNVFLLPDDLTERELRFATILRDADKLDIVRVNVETPRSDIYGVQEDIFLDSEITDEVYEALLQRQNLFRNMMKTPADLMLGHVSFVFGLVYPVSVRLMKEQGYCWPFSRENTTSPTLPRPIPWNKLPFAIIDNN